MDVSRVTAVSQPAPMAVRPGLVVISIAGFLAIGFFVGVALPYLMLNQEVLARYWPRRWWVLTHIATGAIALLTGPVQLWLGVSRRGMRVHRKLGLPWIVTTTMAIAAIRRGLIEQHQHWMIRSYVVTFAFVTFRVLWSILQAAGIGTLEEQLAASSWFCWAVPLFVTEAVLQGRKIFGARQLSGAALVAIVLAMPFDGSAQARLTGADLEGVIQALPSRQVQLALRFNLLTRE